MGEKGKRGWKEKERKGRRENVDKRPIERGEAEEREDKGKCGGNEGKENERKERKKDRERNGKGEEVGDGNGPDVRDVKLASGRKGEEERK